MPCSLDLSASQGRVFRGKSSDFGSGFVFFSRTELVLGLSLCVARVQILGFRELV